MAAKLAIEALEAKGVLPDVKNGKQKSLKKKRSALARLARQAGISAPVFLPAVQNSLSDRWKASIKLTFPAEVRVAVSNSCVTCHIVATARTKCKYSSRINMPPSVIFQRYAQSKDGAPREQIFHGFGDSESSARQDAVDLVKSALSKKGLVQDAPQANLKAKLLRILQLSGLPEAVFAPVTQTALGSPWVACCKLAFAKDVSVGITTTHLFAGVPPPNHIVTTRHNKTSGFFFSLFVVPHPNHPSCLRCDVCRLLKRTTSRSSEKVPGRKRPSPRWHVWQSMT